MNTRHSAACANYSQSTLPLLMWSYLKHLLPSVDPFYNHFCTHNEVQAHVEGRQKKRVPRCRTTDKMAFCPLNIRMELSVASCLTYILEKTTVPSEPAYGLIQPY